MIPKAAFITKSEAGKNLDNVYGQGRKEEVASLVDLIPEVLTPELLATKRDEVKEVRALFSTWGMPLLSNEHLDLLPNLEVVFYGAGSVKGFASPLLERGIAVSSAWQANAVPVAEFCLAQILLACKGYHRNVLACSSYGNKRQGELHRGRGAYGETVALIGVGQVARSLITLLKPFNLRVIVVDPYLSDDEASQLGVTRVSLAQAFAEAYVVSNHLPNLPSLVGEIGRAHFASMRQDATFLNTGRGAQVDESGLIAVLQERQDLTALLDVTFPEPPKPDSPLFMLRNVHLTSHIAGSIADEVLRMADYMIAECRRWQAGKPLKYSVSLEMLERMA